MIMHWEKRFCKQDTEITNYNKNIDKPTKLKVIISLSQKAPQNMTWQRWGETLQNTNY